MCGLSSRLDGWRAIWPFFVKVLFTLLYSNSSNLMENDHNFVFFDCKVSTQQHFESEKLRKHTSLTSPVQYHIFLGSLFHKLHKCLKKMPQCHNLVSGISSFCLQSQNEKLDEKKSCWDCKQRVEEPDTKLWHCDIFFKHSCNLWTKDLKNIWLWIRSVEQFVVADTEGGKFQLDFFL